MFNTIVGKNILNFVLYFMLINSFVLNAEEFVHITDLAGRTVEIKKNPQRIILVRSRDIYGLAALLGNELPQKLIAWGPDLKKFDHDGYRKFTETYPQLAELPEIGDVFSDTVDTESLLRLNPDLILLDIYFKNVGPRSCEKMEKLGLPVIYADQSTNPLESPQKGIQLIGKIFGKEKRASEIIRFVDEQIGLVFSLLKKQSAPPPTVYIETGSTGPDKPGASHGGYGKPVVYDGWASLLKNLNVKNIADGMIANGMGQLNAEYVLQQNPEVIIITGANWNTPGAMRLGYYTPEAEARQLLNGFSGRPGWKNITAVKKRQMYGIYHGFVMHIFDFAGFQVLAKILYPKTFAGINPEKNLQNFYEKFMPVDFSGIWMTKM